MKKYFLTESTAEGLKRLLSASHDISASGVSRTIPGDGESLELPVREDVWRLEWNTTLNAFVILCGDYSLTVDGKSISVGGLTAATAPLDDTDWKTVDRYSGGDLWLVISNGTTTTATVANTPGEGDSETNILIASSNVDDTTGAIEIKQNIVGGICIVTTNSVSSVEGSAERITDNDSDEKTLVDIYVDTDEDPNKLKVNKSRIVTIDDKQTISGRKTFSSLVDIKYDPNDDNKKRVLVIRSDSIEYWAYNSQYAYLKNSVVDSSNGYFDFSSAYPIRVSTTNLTIPTPNTQLVKPSSESASVKATDAVNVQYLRDNLKSLMVNGTEVSKVVSSDNINITTSGSGTISTTDIDVVVDVVYDTSVTPPKLVKKTRKVRAIVGASTDITISDVFVAVPHQSHD